MSPGDDDPAALTLGDSSDGPRVLITGGVHGDEFEPMAAIRRLGRELAGMSLRGRVTLVPVANPSAFRLGQRTGADGLDLARTFPGRPDGSVTERAAHTLAGRIRDADFYVDLHTGGVRLDVYPLVGYMLHPDPRVLAHQRRMAGAFGLPVIWGTSPDLDGRSLSVARDAGIPAIYAEYLGGGGCDPRGVSACVRGCLGVLTVLRVIDGPEIATPAPAVVVEDLRPDSGHMQVQHRAPCGGFFEPAVALGGRVERGRPIGTIVDPLGREPTTVESCRSGVILVLRRFARVEPGEALAVVLETEAELPAWP